MATLPSSTPLTVTNYVNQARVLLQDTKDTPYRYSTADLVVALSNGIREMRRLRPDMFPGGVFNFYSDDGTNSDVVPIDPMYFPTLLMFMVGYAQLRDDEEVTDQRAAAFLGMFQSKLTAVG